MRKIILFLMLCIFVLLVFLLVVTFITDPFMFFVLLAMSGNIPLIFRFMPLDDSKSD